jgi:hypothetical protein
MDGAMGCEDDPDPDSESDTMEQYIPAFDDFIFSVVHILDYTFVKSDHSHLMKVSKKLARELILQAREYKTYHYEDIEHRMDCGEKYRPLVKVYEKDAEFILKCVFNDEHVDLIQIYLFSAAIVREMEELLNKHSNLKLKPQMLDHIQKDQTTHCGQISWINKIKKKQWHKPHHYHDHHRWWWICH